MTQHSQESLDSRESLARGHCVPCEGGIPPLEDTAVKARLKALPDWQCAADSKSISRRYTFDNFGQTMLFVNGLAWMAEAEGHHPDLQVSYGACEVTFTTHAIGGLSENDFICAAKTDALLGVA